MRQDKMRIRLLASPAMDADYDENNILRIPRRARLSFQVTTKKIILNSPGGDVVLDVKQALREDVVVLVAELKAGDISEDDINMTAFVTTATLNKIKGGKKAKENLYITDRLDGLVIGADPEFCLIDGKGLFVRGANVPDFEKTKKLGHDGDLAELRPDPSNDIATVVKNMADLFKTQGKPIEKYGWRGGATYSSGPEGNKKLLRMGGHIHVGDPPIMDKESKHAIYTRIINVLDEYIALPLVRVDTPEASKRRVGHGAYGTYGDQRPQVGRFEYRVPSGFWLIHPDLAAAVLGTTKAVSEACYQLMYENKWNHGWISAPCNRKGLLKTLSCSAVSTVEAIVNKSEPEDVSDDALSQSVQKLEGLPNYSKYKEYIDSFIDIISLSKKDRSNINLDLKETWLGGKHFIK